MFGILQQRVASPSYTYSGFTYPYVCLNSQFKKKVFKKVNKRIMYNYENKDLGFFFHSNSNNFFKLLPSCPILNIV